ncbi:uncharacterized protein LOC111049520 [Nilaparvata lugens]|uniref:uncharacterized protein LOC111049520 n=1 Tax=Nilaparvata lugens TaxID=108931 RepID=UPI00193E7DA7|nr:uncharacterized protein LOC111049520 [Nilaparvata lugens]
MSCASSNSLAMLLILIAAASVHPEVIITGGNGKMKFIKNKSCRIPDSDERYYLSFDGTRRLHPRDRIGGNGQEAVRVRCFDLTQESKAPDLVICFDGEWYPSDHRCLVKTCSPVHNTATTVFTCTTPNGVNVACNQPVPVNTEITIQCPYAGYFTNPSGENNRKLCLDGEWENLYMCQHQCGLVIDKPPTKGKAEKFEEALYHNPWHVVIYHFKDKKWSQKCVGTILSKYVIITTESCLNPIDDKATANPLKSFKVAVGQYYKDYKTAQTLSRIYDIGRIFLSKKPGIALITTKTDIEFNDIVRDVCLPDTWYPEMQTNLQMAILKENFNTGYTFKDTRFLIPFSNAELRNEYHETGKCTAIFENGGKFNATDIGAGLVALVALPNKRYHYYLTGVLVNSTENYLLFIDVLDEEHQRFINTIIKP